MAGTLDDRRADEGATDAPSPEGAAASAPPSPAIGHGGDLAVGALQAAGVDTLFTLSGGHLFPIFDACTRAGVRLVDVRHEQTAAFAAEGVAKLTRGVGVAALTAGPGVTNGISALATAHFNGSPVLVLGGRAPQKRWGAGALQELDHVPMVAPVTKLAATATSTEDVGRLVRDAIETTLSPHRGPAFVDLPMDVLYRRRAGEVTAPVPAAAAPPDAAEVERAGRLLAEAERPVLLAGSDVWWGGAWEALRRCVQALRIPTFASGQGRGCLPADHELAFSRARSALKRADVVAVVGTPLDFRLSYGRFGDAAVVHVADHPSALATHVELAARPAGDLATCLDAMASAGPPRDHESWITALRAEEDELRGAEQHEGAHDTGRLHPVQVMRAVQDRLERDAVVIGDGGDFVSYAGRLIDCHEPGCWLDPGPYGCLGTGLGYSVAARIVHPDRQIVALLGDGAFGFSATDVDTLVRHRLPVVMVVGNNGIWALEKYPMRDVYGYDVAADLQPDCGYEDLARSLGARGERVVDPSQLGPALDRAFASGEPYLVNVMTDPAVSYPRSTSLS